MPVRARSASNYILRERLSLGFKRGIFIRSFVRSFINTRSLMLLIRA